VFAFRMWFIRTLPLSGDESYHWEWSRHLAFGYYDHPGLTAYLIRFFTLCFGRSTEFTVRLPAVLMLGAAAWAAYALARDLAREAGLGRAGSESAGFAAGSLLLFTPVYSAMGVYISTDPPLIAAWTCALWAFHRALGSGRLRWWLAAGAFLGLAMLSKFLAFFMVPALAVSILALPSLRRWLARPHPYAAAACALAVFSPFLWWNATHGWATFMFNFVYRQKPDSVSLLFGPEMLAAQALALSPVIFALAVRETAVSLRRGWLGKGPLLFLALSACMPLAYLLYVSLRQRVGLHWPAAAWTGVMALLGFRAAELWPQSPRRFRSLCGWAAGTAACLTVALHAAVHIPPAWLGRTLAYGGDPGRINTATHVERFGWRELGLRVAEVVREMAGGDAAPRPGGVFLISHEYGLCSNVSFYTPGQPPSHLWSRRKTHGENYRFWDDYRSLAGQDAVFVARSESKARSVMPSLAKHFGEVGEPEELRISAGGRYVRSFFLVRCRGFDGEAPVFAADARRGRGTS